MANTITAQERRRIETLARQLIEAGYADPIGELQELGVSRERARRAVGHVQMVMRGEAVKRVGRPSVEPVKPRTWRFTVNVPRELYDKLMREDVDKIIACLTELGE